MRPATKLLAATAFMAVGFASAASAETTVKIGVLNDQSGLYADLGGPGSVWAAKKAIEDFNATNKDVKAEVVFADHQNKADVGTSVVRKWFDVDGVDAILDVPNSGVALAVNGVAKEKNKVYINSGAASSDLTGKACSPNTVHWTYDTWALANGTGKAVVKTGGDTWFFLVADYAFGHALERDTAEVVKANGGKVVGSVRVPINNADFSSFLLQAQASKAKVIGLANAGGDTINTIKQAGEYGIVDAGQKLAGLLIFITDVHSLGLKSAQGLNLTSPFYWDKDEGTRKFSDAFAKANGGRRPSMVQAGVYSGVLHYLKAVAALKDGKDGVAVVNKMKELPTDDPLFGKGEIRVDGRKIHPMYLFEVKSPADSKGPWDYYTLKATIPAAEAFRPLSEECSLVKKG